jgi:alpha-tubulin suppressor-like RCC1 family protein
VGGALYCWGLNDHGQLGDGTPATRRTPTPVSGNLSFVEVTAGVEFIAGGSHTCGRVASGAVYCWGMNAYGQLGDGTTADKWIPTIVR